VLQGGNLVEVSEVINWIVEAMRESSLEGITFSGGEPFDQAVPLSQVASKARELGLGVLVFTGYTWNELQSSREAGRQELLGASDLLIAGPYEEGNPGNHPLLSSANQQFIFLTGRYRDALAAPARRRAEYRIGADGIIRVLGFPWESRRKN
jgi:anaerobic ribonucleoside-triphosphate reductase activating protein